MSICDFLLKQASFCEYTYEFVTYKVITGQRYLGLDIWLKTLNQNRETEDIIFTI